MNKYITIISRQEWQATGDEFLRCYRFTYDGQNRLKEAVYAEREAMDKHENRYNELVRQYTKNGNIRYFHRRGHKNDFIYGKVDNLEMKYDGNRLISVKERRQQHDRLRSIRLPRQGKRRGGIHVQRRGRTDGRPQQGNSVHNLRQHELPEEDPVQQRKLN